MKLALLSALAAFAVWPAFAQHAPSPQAIKFEDIKWEPLEGGGQISILYTNPTTKATYLIIRPEKDAHVPRHWHTAGSVRVRAILRGRPRLVFGIDSPPAGGTGGCGV
jgi:hypothetical protein